MPTVRRRWICAQILALLMLLLSVSGMSAQEFRGVFYGRVTDSTGAVIPNAVITAKGPQQTYTAKASAKGEFTIPFVQPGTYTVTAEYQGFSSQIKQNVIVDVSTKLTLNFELKAGSQEVVSVNAANDAAALNTSDASGGTVLAPELVQNLPLNGRQVYSLLSLTPGAQFTTTQFGPTGNSGTRAWDETNAYKINGQSGNYNQFAMNGAPVSTQGGGGAGTWNIAPSIDAVDEFKVMTNTYDAQYGRVGGGTVNMTTKSGTNKFHGTLFDFWRNSLFDANYYSYAQQGEAKPFHNEHDFGGTVGGPAYKDKTFFFFSYEGYRQILPITRVTTVPTADMEPGQDGSVNLTNYLNYYGYNGIYDPATVHCVTQGPNGCDKYARDPFPNNTIPGNRISPIASKILAVFPQPNRPGYENNYVAEDPGNYTYNMYIARVDHVFTDKTRMYGAFSRWKGYENRNSSGLPGAAAQGNINNTRSNLTQTVDVTHTFTPRLFLDVRLAYNRAFSAAPNGAVGAGTANLTAKDLGLTMPAIPTTTKDYAPEIDMDDCCIANVIGNEVNPTMFETYDLAPALTQALGKHNLHYGAEFMLFHDVPTGIGQPNGHFWFGPGFTQQNPMTGNNDGSAQADLLLGYPESGSVDNFLSVYESYKDYSAYFQDDWKVSPKLTLNMGIRYEQETSPEDRNYRLNAGFCYTCVSPISGTLAATPTLPNGTTFSQNVVGGPQFSSPKLSPYENYIGAFLPKFGFSYLLAPNLVLRGGYGLSQALGIELGAQSTWEQTTNYVTSLDNNVTPTEYFRQGVPYPNGVLQPAGSSQGLLAGIGNPITFDRRERKIPWVQQYSFGIQGEAPGQIIMDLEYVGSHGTRMRSGMYLDSISAADWNKGHANPSYLTATTANPFYGVLDPATNVGSSSRISYQHLMAPYAQYQYVYDYANPQGYTYYNSMIAKAEHRFAGSNLLTKDLSFLASFTWSKTMDATSRLNNSAGGLVDPNPYYGIDSNDRNWVFSFTGLYGLPLGRGGLFLTNLPRAVDEMVAGWRLSWIFGNQSGLPTPFPNNSAYTCGTNFNIRPATRSYKSYLNNQAATGGGSGCFTSLPQFTTITQLPLTTAVRQPWAQQTQLGVEKEFAIVDNIKFQFRVDAYNATNTPQFPLSTSGVTSPITRITSVADPNAPGAWGGYGTVGSTQLNFPRQFQFSGKIMF